VDAGLLVHVALREVTILPHGLQLPAEPQQKAVSLVFIAFHVDPLFVI
jgi:hypothetical protein